MRRLLPQLMSSPNYCHIQSAYRSAHTTETALDKVVGKIPVRIDEGKSRSTSTSTSPRRLTLAAAGNAEIIFRCPRQRPPVDTDSYVASRSYIICVVRPPRLSAPAGPTGFSSFGVRHQLPDSEQF